MPTSRRYIDAYAVARTVIGIGGFVKTAAYVLAGIVAFGSLVAASQAGDTGGLIAIAGLIYAATIGVALFVLGVLVSAIGQILRATLDTAVNTSRLLTDDEMRQLMSA